MLIPLLTWTQKDKWVVYPRVVDFDAGPSYQAINFSNPSANLTTPYIAENNLVFSARLNLYTMKHLLLYLAGILFSITLSAQNLIPNPSFEEHTDCPTVLNTQCY
ncbi:MAG: hypothetical protein DHS20C18_11280 [Saprospiraceae bacterium]|nr:MAG: hypothetical protein DHS20C18_11280 [Saprospiraceae bacterium]